MAPLSEKTRARIEREEAEDLASFQTYIDSVPYKCETREAMEARLEEFVGTMMVCLTVKDYYSAAGWDNQIQRWMAMMYPIKRTTRAKLARLYYEIILVPGMPQDVMTNALDMLERCLLKGAQRKVEPEELELPWEKLWAAIKPDLGPRKRVSDDAREGLSTLLHAGQIVKEYFPASEIPRMLEEFLPMLQADNVNTVVPLLECFIPTRHIHNYFPLFFHLWEAYNSNGVDDRLLQLCSKAAEENVAGKDGEAGEAGAPWRDVGIFTEAQWSFLMGKCLGSMHITIGATRGTTAAHADIQSVKSTLFMDKPLQRIGSLAKLIIYSMSVDGPLRGTSKDSNGQTNGYLAGSRALESLDKIITCTESFFHPSNTGDWTTYLTTFIHHLAYEFTKRWTEEKEDTCLTPHAQRLTPPIRRAFVEVLRTPALLAMFAKDQIATASAQSALKNLAFLEPNLIMPQLLDRAYGGLETVNETHRVTAVLGVLSAVAMPLISEKLWLGGQKHLLPLLELCLPGIDLNDPAKTEHATTFITMVMQHIKVIDLTQQGAVLIGDEAEVTMDIDSEPKMPNGTDIDEISEEPVLDKHEERALVRDGTAAFADWVTSFLRRVFALFENLPEEGGRRNTTGGKQEESALRAIKMATDAVCLHLSDPLFDLALRLSFDYAVANARSNSVRAFSQFVASLARAQPKATLEKFLPFCIEQVKIELQHGASSERTTTTHEHVPSDTTFHWNLGIIRGILSYAGPWLVDFKGPLFDLLVILLEKARSERGYAGTGRLVSRIVHTLTSVFAYDSRMVNPDVWESEGFNNQNYLHWGKIYEAKDVKVDWHVPTDPEIAFTLEIIEKLVNPCLDTLNKLLETPMIERDKIWRNDFCRHLHFVRSAWNGLPTVTFEQGKQVVRPNVDEETEVAGFGRNVFDLEAGFALKDPADPRYQAFTRHRLAFGKFLHCASQSLLKSEAEDQVDAVMALTKGIDAYLLSYAVTRDTYVTVSKQYKIASVMNAHPGGKEKEYPRNVWLKRAQLYHVSRLYCHSLSRKRSALDDELILDLVDFSLSSYLRVRRSGQAILANVAGYYNKTDRLWLPKVFEALETRIGDLPDRTKGALHVLLNKETSKYAMHDILSTRRYITSVLDCHREEKPSIQKLVMSVAAESMSHIHEEFFQTQLNTTEAPGVIEAVDELKAEFSQKSMNQALLKEGLKKRPLKVQKKTLGYQALVDSLIEIARRPNTHWRYIQTCLSYLIQLLRRDIPPSPEVAKLLCEHAISDHPTVRWCAQRGLMQMMRMVKIRTYGTTPWALWKGRGTYRNPLRGSVAITDPASVLPYLQRQIKPGSKETLIVDQIGSGTVVWGKSLDGYWPAPRHSPGFEWDAESQPMLQAMRETMSEPTWFRKLSTLNALEGNREFATVDLRSDQITFFKWLFKIFRDDYLDIAIAIFEPLWTDLNPYSVRAGCEFVAGLIRGSKLWSADQLEKVWTWFMSRVPLVYSNIKPDTVHCAETMLSIILSDRDPRRVQPLVDWIFNLPLDFAGDSAFEMSKAIGVLGLLTSSMGERFEPYAERYLDLFFENTSTTYAEIRSDISQSIDNILKQQWHPSYRSVDALLEECITGNDPFQIRAPRHVGRIKQFAHDFPRWKEERLPPPRVNQSQYDRVGLTLLRWIWSASHGPQATLIWPYLMPLLPEILRMSELGDSSDLQRYSSGVLYVISAIPTPAEYIEPVMDALVDTMKASTSWRVRLNALPFLSIFYVRNLLRVNSSCSSRIMDVLLECLKDEIVEVREQAAKSLSAVIRCSQRQSIVPLKERFSRVVRRVTIPNRKDPNYSKAVQTTHSGILGLVALIDAYPYSVEPWMPPMTILLARHASDPPPISTTIRKCAADFRKTHQDTWHVDQRLFDEEQLQALSTMLGGASYYA